MDEQLDEIQGEVKTNIEKMLKECEVENKEKASAVEYYNCIFLSGNGDVNTLLNNGTINGTVAQGTISGNGGMGDEGHKQTLYNFHTESGIKDFIGDYAKKRELCTFLSIAFLECIPEFLWIEIRNKLFECMYICSEEKRTIIDEADFSYKDDELELMHLVTVPAECETQLGRVQTNCILFMDKNVGKQVVKVICNQYLGIKESIYNWLLMLRECEKINHVLAYQVSNAFGKLAVYDWTTLQNTIVMRFVQEKGNSNRNYLVKMLSYYLQNSPYDRFLDDQIKFWISEHDEFLWEVSYRLYNVNKEYCFNAEIAIRMRNYILKDKRWRCCGNGIYQSKWNPKIDIYPAYYSEELQELFLKILLEIYQNSHTYLEESEFEDYFIWLLTLDFRLEGFPKCQLMFASVLGQKEIRNDLRKMYIQLWQKYRIRKTWQKIIENHFVELEKNGKSWNYMQDFFKTLAFTGEKEAFDDICEMLAKMKNSKRISGEVKNWLLKILQERGKEE